jgi:hypothetical protein
MSYTNIFGGYNINTAFPSYMEYVFAANLQLTWASSFVSNTNVTAQNNDLNATVANLTVTLGDATLISVGMQVQFNNLGANPISINDFSGGEIAVIPITDANQIILYLRDNTTQAGEWGVTQLGSGESSVNATELAGLGTIALNGQINTNFPSKQLLGAYQVLLNDRASLLVWAGGVNTITLPTIASLAGQNGFFIAVNNEGSGVVTIATPDGSTIDGNMTFLLNPGQSAYFINVAANWNTLGYGTNTYFQVQTLNLPIAIYSGTYVNLTAAQSAPLIQNYTGVLTGNVNIYYPAAAGQWYVFNNTSGAGIVTIQLGTNLAPVGNPIVIPQGNRIIAYSDGTTMYTTPTTITTAIFEDGSVGSPSITFVSDTTTGFSYEGNGVVTYSSGGVGTIAFGGEGSPTALVVASGLAGVYANSSNTRYEGFRGSNALTSNIIWTLPPSDATLSGQIIYSNAANQLNFTTTTYPLTTALNSILFASANNVIGQIAPVNNGLFISTNTGAPTWLAPSNNNVLIATNTGMPQFSNTLPALVQGNITILGTIISGTWSGTTIGVGYGGTGIVTTTPYGVICGGTTGIGAFQNVGSLGTSGQVLTSQGAGTLPTWITPPSGATFASPTQQKAASTTSYYTSPAYQQYHPSAASFWVNFQGSNGAILAQFNVASVVRNSVGQYTITYSDSFTSSNYVVLITVRGSIGNPVSTIVNAQSATNCTIITFASGASPTDYSDVYMVGFGVLT